MVANRFSQVPVSAPGTTEQAWQEWGVRFKPLSLEGCQRLIVVAAHPDDEILGVGGLMAIATVLGIKIELLALTDGDAAFAETSAAQARAQIALRLREERPEESKHALWQLGVDIEEPVRLALPDGKLSDHVGDIDHAVRELIGDEPGTWCAAPWRDDDHPDHDAAGRATARACSATGTPLLEYPIWMWHWATPGDADVPWEQARTIDLPADIRFAKRRAVAEFRSQVISPEGIEADPILPPHVLQRLLRDTETVFV